MKTFNFHPILIYISLIASIVKRILKCHFFNAFQIFKLLLNETWLLKTHHYYNKK